MKSLFLVALVLIVMFAPVGKKRVVCWQTSPEQCFVVRGRPDSDGGGPTKYRNFAPGTPPDVVVQY